MAQGFSALDSISLGVATQFRGISGGAKVNDITVAEGHAQAIGGVGYGDFT
jgi:hypothetical protein